MTDHIPDEVNAPDSAPDRVRGRPDAAPDHRTGATDDGMGLTFPFADAPKPGDVRAVADDILWVRMPLPWSLDHINLYLLKDGDGWLLVDTGVSSDACKTHWQQIFDTQLGGAPISRVLLTHHHPDHLGLAGWIAEQFSAPVLATRTAYLLARALLLDSGKEVPIEVLAFSKRAGLHADMIERQKKGGWGRFAEMVYPLPVGYRRIAGGDRLIVNGVDWHVIETAGHAPGHASLYAPKRKLLLSGDQVLPLISSNVSVTPTEPDGNPLEEWLYGLARLRALPDDTLVLPSHNMPFYGLGARLDALISKHVTRLGAVADMCDGPVTAIDIFPALFRRRVRGLEFAMATGEALAHLHFLQSLGVVRRKVQEGVARFERIADYDPDALCVQLNHLTDSERTSASWLD